MTAPQEADRHKHEWGHSHPTRGPLCRAAGGSRVAGGGLRRFQLAPGGRRRLTGQLRVGQRGRLLGLHALARRTRLPRPRTRRKPSERNAQDFGVSDSQYQTAERACQCLLPSSNTTFAASLTQCLETGDCPAAVVQRALTEGLKFARCMRNDGVPNWPDPTIDSMGRPSFQVTAAGISIASTRSSQMLSKIGLCQDQPGAVLVGEE